MVRFKEAQHPAALSYAEITSDRPVRRRGRSRRKITRSISLIDVVGYVYCAACMALGSAMFGVILGILL